MVELWVVNLRSVGIHHFLMEGRHNRSGWIGSERDGLQIGTSLSHPFTGCGLKVGGGRTSLRSPDPCDSTRGDHSICSRLAQAGLIEEATSLLSAFTKDMKQHPKA